MFGIGRKTRDIITIFHKPSSQTSVRILNLLKQQAATASETATEDQASDHTGHHRAQRTEYDLDVTEAAPTSDQLKAILEYAGSNNIGQIIKGAGGISDAVKKLSQSSDTFIRPVVVDWSNGKAVTGENESEILKMLRQSEPKDP
ncbi:MAG: hypothetical protein M1831_006340 [Alyxoria varia]|nr:MAG: hypothetical protein M1831_006340 [Alyxoria varia]